MTNELLTGQVAGILGVPKITLIKWVNRGLLHPRVAQMGGLRMWFWSQAEVGRAVELAGLMRQKRKRKEETT
jgi:predicted site-specific integrase-resolvase